MALFDDDKPVKRPVHEIGQDLSLLSVDELAQRIALLHEEIARLEADREAKANSRSAAEGFFKS